MIDEQGVKLTEIHVLPEEMRLPADAQRSLLEQLIKHKVAISHSCGGMGSCGTCRVIVEEGLASLGPRDSVESELAKEYGYTPRERLACQNRALGGLTIRLPKLKNTETDESQSSL
jgi:ferredoxin